ARRWKVNRAKLRRLSECEERRKRQAAETRSDETNVTDFHVGLRPTRMGGIASDADSTVFPRSPRRSRLCSAQSLQIRGAEAGDCATIHAVADENARGDDPRVGQGKKYRHASNVTSARPTTCYL